MPNKLLKTCRRELDLSNCGFDNDYADSMVRSQWQSRSTNRIYLLYRWMVAIFLVAVVIESVVPFQKYGISIRFFLIYFTNWGILMNMTVGVMGAILVTVWHFHTDFQGTHLVNSAVLPLIKMTIFLHFFFSSRKCSITK